MNTSREIYNRIRWDDSLDETLFSIGYQERGKGLRETPFGEFDPTVIPWDRVWQFKLGDVVVWDRRQRVDLFHEGRIQAIAQSVTRTSNSVADDRTKKLRP